MPSLNQVLMNSHSFPWKAGGQIYSRKVNGDKYTCTITLVAADTVLANAHCVLNPETREFSRTSAFLSDRFNSYLVTDENINFAVDVLADTDFINQPNARAED